MYTPANFCEEDIFHLAADMKRCLDFYRAAGYPEQVGRIDPSAYRNIVLAGMGSSYSIVLNPAAELANAGFNASAVIASDLLLYRLPSVGTDTLVIMVSQSGESAEIAELCRRLPAETFVLAVTNDPQSTLAKRGNLTLLLHMETEKSASTRSYLAPTLLMHLVTEAMLGRSTEKAYGDLVLALDDLEESVGHFGEWKESVRSFLGLPPYLAVIARGWSYCTADDGSLFIKETAKYPAVCFEAAQFRHGPFELVEEGFAAFVFIPAGPGEAELLRMASDIAKHGGKVVAVAQEGVAVPEHPNILPLYQKYVSQRLAPVGNILPMFVFGIAAAEQKGLEVGVFRSCPKVTTTL
ncbi:MAG TPA: SIS domain-containing protein [Oscillospiraceae bacterium]|nr:SIS domain-containing protein [Oscillospiraceae bacterium]